MDTASRSRHRRADPGARRQALLLVILGTIGGALLIAGFDRYRAPLSDWLLSEPQELERRVQLLLFAVASALTVPLVAFAVYLWFVGSKVVQSQEFPPPGQRVIRDTPVIVGAPAVLRGRGLKVLAICLAVASVVLALLLWRLAGLVTERVA